jgi:hypothetical protein
MGQKNVYDDNEQRRITDYQPHEIETAPYIVVVRRYGVKKMKPQVEQYDDNIKNY